MASNRGRPFAPLSVGRWALLTVPCAIRHTVQSRIDTHPLMYQANQRTRARRSSVEPVRPRTTIFL